MTEIFKDIEGYEGDYQVSDYGNVKSFKLDKEGRILKSNIDGAGYLYVVLCKDNKQKTYRVHKLWLS